MLEFLNPLRGVSFAAVLLKVVLATVFGMVIGLERSYRNRPTGFRTHVLVCLEGGGRSHNGIVSAIGI